MTPIPVQTDSLTAGQDALRFIFSHRKCGKKTDTRARFALAPSFNAMELHHLALAGTRGVVGAVVVALDGALL